MKREWTQVSDSAPRVAATRIGGVRFAVIGLTATDTLTAVATLAGALMAGFGTSGPCPAAM